eukprot:736757-Pleurochrysis_carterae.AAC.1
MRVRALRFRPRPRDKRQGWLVAFCVPLRVSDLSCELGLQVSAPGPAAVRGLARQAPVRFA